MLDPDSVVPVAGVADAQGRRLGSLDKVMRLDGGELDDAFFYLTCHIAPPEQLRLA